MKHVSFILLLRTLLKNNLERRWGKSYSANPRQVQRIPIEQVQLEVPEESPRVQHQNHAGQFVSEAHPLAGLERHEMRRGDVLAGVVQEVVRIEAVRVAPQGWVHVDGP